MALLQALLGQTIFLIILAAAGVLLLLAVLLAILSQMQAFATRRKLRRLERAAALESAPAPEEALRQPHAGGSTPPIHQNAAAAGHSTPLPVVTTATPPAGKPTGASAAPAAPAATPTPTAETPVSDGIKDLLSVFVEDQNSEKRLALLKDLPEIDVRDLATLSAELMDALRDKAASS